MSFPAQLPQVEEPDIVRVILDLVKSRAPAVDDGCLEVIEHELRQAYGGLRVRIPKRKKHLTDAQRAQLVADAMTSATDLELTQRHGVHRSTLYRQIKRGVVERGK